MRYTEVVLFVVAISLASSTSNAAGCKASDDLTCWVEPCGNTYCMKCKDDDGGGTLECDRYLALGTLAVTPIKPHGGDLLRAPEIMAVDFGTAAKDLGRETALDPVGMEKFRLKLEKQNSDLENYRQSLEALRRDGGIDTQTYQDGLKNYWQGIENYNTGMSLVRKAQ